jgi:hypothetical protein
MINSRMSRAVLQPGIQYIKIIEVNGKIIEEDVGMFVRSYRMGSGDGTTIHWEFNKDGVIKTIDDLEDAVDLPTIYKIIDVCAGVKINKNEQTNEPMPQTAKTKSENSWENLDLVKLESELFLLGIWKNYDELESNISMPEMMAILESRRELDYNEKKFLAAMQGVDLDEASGTKEEDPWEAMKARVAAKTSGIGNGDPNDVTSLQGQKAAQYGFGIGMGLDYEVISK